MFSSTESNEDNREHLNTTIITGVSIIECFNHGLINETEKELLCQIYPEGRFYCWGTHDGVTKKQFDKIEDNDFVIGTTLGFITIIGTVSYIMERENPELGRYLWGSPDWKWIFFIKDIERVNVGQERPFSLIGYSSAYVVQGLMVKEHDNNNYFIDLVKGTTTWDEVSIHVPEGNTRTISLTDEYSITKRNGEVVTKNWEEIIKAVRRSLRDNEINRNADNVFSYFEGTLDGVENKKIYYGRVQISRPTFERLYTAFKRKNHIH